MTTRTFKTTLQVTTEPVCPARARGKGVLAYQCVLESTGTQLSTWEGLCLTDNTPNPVNQKPVATEMDDELDSLSQIWRLVNEDFLAMTARWGFEGSDGSFPQWKEENGMISMTPFTHLRAACDFPGFADDHAVVTVRTVSLKDSSGGRYRPVLVDNGGHMLFDAKGEALPVGLHFSYINGGMSDQYYDLDKAMACLSTHPHVQRLERNAIEYYNVSEEQTETLDFWWCPDVETYRRAWANCRGKYRSTNFRSAIFRLDLLGLRAAGAARDKTAQVFGGEMPL